MDFEFDWQVQSFRAELRRFLDAELPSDWKKISESGPGSDRQAAFSKQFCARLAEVGWLTPHWPAIYGGSELDLWYLAVLSEEMWAVGEPRGPQYMNVNWIGPAIIRYGTEQQRREFLPPMSQGRSLWCQGFSEPDAGSDLAALRTRATLDADHYVVSGQKTWTSYANHAEHCFLLARTDPSASGTEGISVFLVDMETPGVEVREIPAFVGSHYFHDVYFDDVRVPASRRLGPEHRGWDVVRFVLAQERVGSPRYARALRTIDVVGDEATQSGLANDLIDPLIGVALARCEAARLLAYKVVDQRRRDLPPTGDVNIARVANTQADRAAAELALTLEGNQALQRGSAADSSYRLAVTAGIAVGTTEVQLDLIASRRFGFRNGWKD